MNGRIVFAQKMTLDFFKFSCGFYYLLELIIRLFCVSKYTYIYRGLH